MNDLRKKQAKKAGLKSLYELTEAELETLLDASIKYSKECDIYKKNCNIYQVAEQTAKSRFNIDVKSIKDRLVYINQQYNLLRKTLFNYRINFIANLFTETFKYETRVDRYFIGKLNNVFFAEQDCKYDYETYSYSIEAKPVTARMDNLRYEYDELINKREELRVNLLKSMPQRPERPDVVINAWHNGFSLTANTPTTIRKVMVQTNQSQDLRAKATAYDNKQRQEAWSVRRKIVNQIHLFPSCPYCGDGLSENDAHADHIYPVSKGGQSTIRNMVFVCTKCNSRKKDLTLRNFIAKYDLNGDFIHKNLDTLGKDF